jgi:eukaryotic-like serine/threonine-protein kinase
MITVAEPGSVFAGKYKVEKLIGTGGMGVIISATHMQLEQRVAIKLLTSDAALDPERVGRFSREAKAAARIQSEHVVRILDYGTHPSGAPFIVMEHLVGSDLAMAVKTRGGLPVDEAVDYMIQACDGVAEAHVAGIIHRDLKPANLFLTRKKDGVPIIKVLDFGASKLTAECSLATSDLSKTHASSLIGSPRYMAPEQLKAAHEIDSRADIYALGATLFELLAGEPVFKAESISRIFTKILWDAAPSITQFRDDVPPGLDALLFRCLQKRPEDRYQTVKALVEALAEFAPERSAGLVAQIARIGRPPASIAPPPRPVMKRQPSTGDGGGAPAFAPALMPPVPPPLPHEAGSATDGSVSMSTMAVLRAAQIDRKARRVATLVGAVVAVIGVAAALFVFVIRPKMTGGLQHLPKPAETSVAPAETVAANVQAPLPPKPTVAVAKPADAAVVPTWTPGIATASATTRPRSGDRPTATTSSRHGGRTPGTASTTAKPTSDAPPVVAPPPKPTGDFTDFGNRK